MTTATLRQPVPLYAAVGQRLWRFFCSVKLAVVFGVALVLCSLAGTFIIQAPGFVQAAPSLYADWLAVQAFPRFGDATEFMAQLGLFNLFQALWFRMLLVFVGVQIVVCTLNRYPSIQKAVFEPQVRRNDAFYERNSHVRRFDSDLGADGLNRVLRKNGFRVLSLAEGGSTYVYGDRNGWAKLATFASHIGLIVVLLGGMFSHMTAFERELIVPDGATQPLYPVAHPEQVQVLNRGFVVETYPDGRPSDFYSDLVLFQGGQQVAEKRIRVNDPLEHNGFVYYQASFGKAIDLEIRDGAGNVLVSENASLLANLGPIQFREFPLPNQRLNLVVALVPEPGRPAEQSTVPQPQDTNLQAITNRLAILGFRPSENPNGPIFNITVPPGEERTIEGVTIANRGEGFFTGLRVRKDPGLNVILGGAILFIVFSCVTFYFPRRRVWARITGHRVALGGNADRFIDLEAELRKLEAAAAPDRPPSAPAS